MKKFVKENSNIFITIFVLFLIFIFIDDILGKSIIGRSVYNSYELQTKAWLNGKVFLDHNYSYLELAIYKGHYYVSFPPFPSLFLLPFVILFNDNIPTNLISFGLFVFNFIIIYKILKRNNDSELVSILIASGFTVGTNLMSLAVDSGVWFIAQLLNNSLCLLAIDAFLKNKKILVYLYLSLAVGCRPFSAIYIIMFFIYYLYTDKNDNKIIKNIISIIPVLIVGIIYMWYNYIRFENIFEFGHNYLPEFVNSKYGQFNLVYLLPNLRDFLFNKIHIDNKLNLHFDMPFSLLIANPIIMLYLYRTIKNIIKTKKIDMFKLIIFIFMLFNIILICMHKTLGGWQFGARYSCDILPFVFLGLILCKNKKENQIINLDKFEVMCIIFGIIINIFGTILMYSR